MINYASKSEYRVFKQFHNFTVVILCINNEVVTSVKSELARLVCGVARVRISAGLEFFRSVL